MKKGKYILLIFLIFFFLILVTFLAFLYYEFQAPPSVKANSYLEIKLSGEVQENPTLDFFSSLFLGKKPLSLYDIWMNLKKAKVDARIQAVLLRLGYLQCDWGKISELREAVLDFRRSGKKIYAYIEDAPDFDKEYYLATACDRIILHPLGWLGVNGIGGYHPFFKRALDKLGIEAEFEQVEEYKTAYNIFTEDHFTEAHKKMMESLYGEIFSLYIKTVAEARNKSEEEVKRLIDQGFYQGENAQQVGLVDDILYEDEVINLLKGKEKRIHKISHEEYAKIAASSLDLEKGRKIALIYGVGPIHEGESLYQTMGSSTLARWLKLAREDKSIAAVVFRVDSPGGSALASDIIWREIVLTKKEKPVVVSMSDVAGSGGYWVSMAAHKIVAQPQTLTGSIGVLSGKFNLSRLYEKLGITAEKLTYGKRADIFSSFRSLTAEERELLKKEILWIYDRFLMKVAEGRNLSKEEVDKIGKGRVWTGSQAKAIGLVDEIGGLKAAIELAKKLRGIPPEEEVKLIVWPKKISLWGLIFGRKDPNARLALNSRIEKILFGLSSLEREHFLALMPFFNFSLRQ